ncbi:hypothetical protein EIP91_000414 [Steccherinum ochraceum]|uniref:Uncharacterized protein n=1 Tax=Steccherinum ochraceum TaxID=92696 RepID=A0A4V2MWR0_9APHY|nr:hypothetical protein EIP91_000414 [Steccherinum ochraceum]
MSGVNLSALTTALGALVTNGFNLATLQTNAGSKLTADMNNAIDWTSATQGWVQPIALLTVYARNLAGLAADFSTYLPDVVNASSESGRTSSLWTFIATINTTPRLSTTAFESWQTSMATCATNFATILTSTSNTDPALLSILSTLQKYNQLIPAAIQAAQVLDNYQTSVGEEVAGIMMWAAKPTVSGKDIPFLLKTFKYTSTSSYDSDNIILTNWTQTNWLAFQGTTS